MGGKGAAAEAIRRALDWQGIAFAGVRLGALAGSWERAASLFYPARRDGAIAQASQVQDGRLALATLVLAGLVIFAIGVAHALESMYIGNLQLEAYGEITGTVQPRFDLLSIIPAAAFQFLLYVAAGTVLTAAHDGIAFLLFRISGGMGTLRQQLYSGSVVWLAAAFTMSAALLLPLPCLDAIGIGAMFLVCAGYVLLYMGARMNAKVHGISMLHAGAAGLPLLALRLGLWIAATDTLTIITGISPLISAGA